MRIQWLSCLLLITALFAHGAETKVPDALKPWQSWVLHDQGFRQCPLTYGQRGTTEADFACTWYGSLRLSVTRQGGQFQLPVEVFNESLVRLPGSRDAWPREVTDGLRTLPVLDHQGMPFLALTPGKYQLSGQLAWSQQPYKLMLPEALALVELRIQNKRIAQPAFESGGVLLAEQSEQQSEQPALEIDVYRRLDDGIPLTLTTVIDLSVSGKAREQALGIALPPGFQPTALRGELNARLDDNQQLRVQLKPGDYQLQIDARAVDWPTTISLQSEAPWPAEEIWSWQSNGLYRTASIDGVSPIDPSNTGMPDEWRQLPAFVVKRGDTLQIDERQRGRQVTDNSLHLQRQLWLRFDGERYAFLDQINGQMRDGWRLAMPTPYQLQAVRDHEQSYPLSTLPEQPAPGVELRNSYLNITANGLLARQAELPILGWSSDFDSAQIDLNLPPGYMLLTATGVENVYGALLEQWSLWHVFLMVFTAVLIYRWSGPVWAGVMLVAYFWLYHEPDMPHALLINLLLAVFAAKFASGKLGAWLQRYRTISVVLLLLAFVPFAAQQLRALMHPQLERSFAEFAPELPMPAAAVAFEDEQPVAMEVQEPIPIEMRTAPREMVTSKPKSAADAIERKAERIEVVGSRIKQTDLVSRYADNQVSATGQGIPNWQWNRYQLQWQHPVQAGETMQLWIISYPVRVLIILASLLVFSAWLLHLLRSVYSWPSLPKSLASGSAVSFFALLLLPLSLLHSADARATIPTPELLKELQQRLTEAPECAPSCVSFNNAEIRLNQSGLRVELEVHALAATTIPVPGDAEQWLPLSIERNGQRVLSHWRNRTLHLNVPAGRHRFVLQGSVPDADRFSLAFPLRPSKVSVAAEGWETSGVDGDLLNRNTISFVRQAELTSKAGEQGTRAAIKPFFHVERTLHFDTEWFVVTTVTRMAPERGALSLWLPLLAGESVTREGFVVQDNKVRIDLAADQDSEAFESRLQRVESLTLQAPESVNWIEVWALAPSNLWRLRTRGTPQISTENSEDWLQTFAPRPGESLQVEIIRPELIGGETLAFDEVHWSQNEGERQGTGELRIQYRATKGGEHTLNLPADWQIIQILHDNRPEMLRPKEGKLTFPVLPGSHRLTVQYRSNQPVSLLREEPNVDLQLPAANIQMQLTLPDNRWVLFTGGPTLGPAVLYWNLLLVFALVAIALVRSRLLPLSLTDALLLGLGLSTVSWWIIALVFGWLIVMQWRKRAEQLPEQSWFNSKQVLLIGLSLLALLCLVVSVPRALLESPDMLLTGNGSYGNYLRWYSDFSESMLPDFWVVSVPLWLYKGAMLLWSIWLSFALLRWTRYAWSALNVGQFWRRKSAVKTADDKPQQAVDS